MRILLAEDYAAQAESLEILLAAYGHTVYRAANGLGAKELAELHQIDAAVVDLVMPGMDGLALLAWLRGRPETEEIPVVLSSGMPPDATPGLDPGSMKNVAFLQKPYSLEELLAALGATP